VEEDELLPLTDDETPPAVEATRMGQAFPRGGDFVSSRIPKLAHLVANRLRWQMSNGQLRPGDTLPREAELITRFGVSRPALREALRILEAESLIAIGRGTRGGATILQPTIDKVAQYGGFCLVASGTRLSELHDARTLVEPSVVERLAQNQRPEILAELRRCTAEGLQALAIGDLKGAIMASNSFHEHLSRSSDNRAISLLVGILHDISVHNYALIEEQWSNDPEKRPLVGKAFRAHRKVTDLIEAGRCDEAKQFWHGYMVKTGELLASTGHDADLLALGT